jgi:large subunit ribosomal protein L32e
MAHDIKKLLEIKKAQNKKRPRFVRQDWHKKSRLALVWRKPKGMDSKLRKHMHGHGHLPTTGYRTPVLVRGMHKSGLVPVLVHTTAQLETVNAKTHGIIIASTVGARKCVDIITKAQSKGVRVLNYKDPAKKVQAVKDGITQRKKEAAKSAPAKVAVKPAPGAKKPEVSQEEKKEQEKREAEKVITGKQ